MSSLWVRLLARVLVMCAGSYWLAAQGVLAQSNGVLREVYGNISGSSLSDLTNNPSFPANPTLETIQPEFEAPPSYGDHYGTRMRALLVPPATGNYVFWIATDDQGMLYLSTDHTPERKVAIARVNAWTSSREWTKETNQMSAPIPLVAGQRYYIEALQKEGGGGDNLAVRWQLPGGTIEAPIPGNRLLIYGLGPPVITGHPTNAVAVEGASAGFSIRMARYIGVTYQWQRNDISMPGATSATYVIPAVTLGDNNTRYRCLVVNALGATNSNYGILTVVADTTRPALVSVGTLGDPEVINVTFSEPVEVASASDPANYALNQDAQVLEAAMGDSTSLILTTTPLSLGISYTLTVNGVRDRATTPNTIASNSQKTFSLTYTPLDISRVAGTPEPLGPCSRRTGLVISEIMFHPAPRADGANLEFVELYNSQEWPEDLSGYRLSGQIDFTFPSNTVLAARSMLVVAASSADMRTVYGLAGVYGPFTNSLSNGSGTVRLRNHLNAVLLEASYGSDAPFPPAADGAGHSLVLARPSFGERNPLAWGRSERIGGSPRAAEPTTSTAYRTVRINEFLAHTEAPELDYIELYNYGSSGINLSGCVLTDDPATNKFIMPSNTVISARGYLVFTPKQLGFALSSEGETIYFKHTNNLRIMDAVRFGDQANGVASGRWPDGGTEIHPLSAPTPGTANALPRMAEIVINEIMYHPISGDSDEEFIELHNPGPGAVRLDGWRLTDGISYTFPSNTTIAAAGYLVIARDKQRLFGNHSHLNEQNTAGDYNGSLANSGERVALTRPEAVVITNQYGAVFTNILRITVDAVTYGTGGRWGRWSDGSGSSLELIDPRANRNLAPNWADSDETGKSGWVTIEHTGVLDLGSGPAETLQIFLLGAGECLVDDIEVVPSGGGNVLPNPSFNAGFTQWTAQGNQYLSTLAPTGGVGNGPCMHLRATGRGDTGANRVWSPLNASLSSGATATIRARVRWLKGNPEILLRLHGNWLEATGKIINTRNLGTPGLANSVAQHNPGPAITDVQHSPVLPTPGQAVTVSAQVQDPDRLGLLLLKYRLDPATNWLVTPMSFNGAGFYSGVIPGQSTGTVVGFYIEAQDNGNPRAATTFPNDAPRRECLVRFGDPASGSRFTPYRFWLSQRIVDQWSVREKLSNDPLDGTFVYGNYRVIYNAGGQYGGSPYHSPGYNSPVGNPSDYVWWLPEDDRVLNDTDINLLLPGNGCCDGTLQREQTAYWLAYQLGLPFTHRRHVEVYVNGLRRSVLMEDAQQPNRDMVDQWFPNGENGDLHKIQIWFEFDAAASSFTGTGASLNNFTTTGGRKKLARYRWNWASRAFQETANDYTNLFAMIDAVNTSGGGDTYTRAVQSMVDVNNWMRTFAVEHIVGNVDSWGYGGGQNMFAYKPLGDTWKLLIWDIDFAFVHGTPEDPLFNLNNGQLTTMANHPQFRRLFLRAYKEAANGPLLASRIDPILDARYNAFVSAGVNAQSPAGIKSYVSARRAFILSSLSNYNFALTISGPDRFSTNRNLINLTGTAPPEVDAFEVNGVVYQPTWSTETNWTLRVALNGGTNNLVVQGLDAYGHDLGGATRSLEITFTGVEEPATGRVIINEMMYRPTVADAEFIEIVNNSASTAYDLSGWRIEGLDYTFPDGVILEPGRFLVVAQDAAVFAATYGSSIALTGEFEGRFDPDGELIRLIKPGQGLESPTVVDEVRYEVEPPWPQLTATTGASLQLVDVRADNALVSSWAAVTWSGTNPTQRWLILTNNWKYYQNSALDGTDWTAPGFNDTDWPSGAALLGVSPGSLPAPINTALTLGQNTYYFRTTFYHQGSPLGTTLRLNPVVDDGAVFYLNGQEVFRLGMPNTPISYATAATRTVTNAVYEGAYLLSGWPLQAGENVLAVEVHQATNPGDDVVFGTAMETWYRGLNRSTPGGANSVRYPLPPVSSVWLNEIALNNGDPTNRITDSFGDADPWVELFNASTNEVSLSDYYLANNYTNILQWRFPANARISPGEFRLVWLDGETHQSTPVELHAGFRASTSNGAVVLAQGPRLTDYINYNLMRRGRSKGAFPDGSVLNRKVFYYPTPGASNNPTLGPADVFVNEWMAGNAGFLADPADGSPPDYEDWFELYNAGTEEVELGGYYLTDVLTNRTKWRIPDGTVIPPKGFLLVWADEEAQQNGFNADLHTNFRLSLGGEQLGLYAPDGSVIDAVTFGPQTNNISQGRIPNGATNLFHFAYPTPAGENVITLTNTPPILPALAERTVAEGELLSFTCEATDLDRPLQKLTYTLETGVPLGAILDATNGVFSWVPGEEHGPGEYIFQLRVTDTPLDGTLGLSVTQTFRVVVTEVNNAPVLAPLLSATVDENNAIVITNSASDPDDPNQAFAFSLEGSIPRGMAIDPFTGRITWTPDETHGPAQYPLRVRVSELGPDPLSDIKTLSVYVNEVNTAPVLAPISNLVVCANAPFTIQLSSSDEDFPPNDLLYGFTQPPPHGATLDPVTGLLGWRPGPEFIGLTNLFYVQVIDNGLPVLRHESTFTVVVMASLQLRAWLNANGICTLEWATQEGKSYQIEATTQLPDPAWTPVGETQLGTGSTLQRTVTIAPETQRFYRVRELAK